MQAEQETKLAVPWTAREAWLGALLLIPWLGVGLAAAVLIELLPLDVDPGLLVTFGEVLLLLPILWITSKYGAGWRTLGLRGFGAAALGVGCGYLVLFYIFNLVYSLALASLGVTRELENLLPIFEDLSSPWPLFVGGMLVAPFVEEVFFRGFLFAGLRNGYRWWVAALISAGLFALLHLQPTNLIPIFLLGFLFAYLYQLSGSIWPGIFFHSIINTVSLLLVYYQINFGP